MAKAKTCVITASGKRVCGRPTTGASGAVSKAERKAEPKLRYAVPAVQAMLGESAYGNPLPQINIMLGYAHGSVESHHMVMALGHRIAADVLDASGSNRWAVTLLSVTDRSSRVSIETRHESPAELAAAMAILSRVAAKYQK